jgi:hypothetical protein
LLPEGHEAAHCREIAEEYAELASLLEARVMRAEVRVWLPSRSTRPKRSGQGHRAGFCRYPRN